MSAKKSSSPAAKKPAAKKPDPKAKAPVHSAKRPGAAVSPPATAPRKHGATLDFLSAITDTAKPSPFRRVSIDSIRPDPNQPRQTFNPIDGVVAPEELVAIRELADTIDSEGLIEPIIIKEIGDDCFELVAGERRWRAFHLNRDLGRQGRNGDGYDEIEAIVRDYEEVQGRLVQLGENIHRRDLTDYEVALHLKRMLDDFPELQQRDLAQLLKKDHRYVSKILAILDPRFAALVEGGHIVYAAILEKFKALTPEAQERLATEAQKSGERITSGKIRAAAKPKVSPPPPAVAPPEQISPVEAAAIALFKTETPSGETYTPPTMQDGAFNDGGISSPHVPRVETPAGNAEMVEAATGAEQLVTLHLHQLVFYASVAPKRDAVVSARIPTGDMRTAITKLGGKVPEDDLSLLQVFMDTLNAAIKASKKK